MRPTNPPAQAVMMSASFRGNPIHSAQYPTAFPRMTATTTIMAQFQRLLTVAHLFHGDGGVPAILAQL